MVNKCLYRTENINKYFPGVHALKDVDFDLNTGEIHGIVGHNGAGKSTLVKVLTGAYIPEKGNLFLEDGNIAFSHPREAIDHGIGIVSQEGTLVPGYTGIENIFLGNEINKFGFINEQTLKENAYKLLGEIGLNIDLERPVEDLIPAQRKVIEILKVISLHPKVMIFDEPTAALSDKERNMLFDLMNKFKKNGLGIIFITHYIEEVLNMCDRITVLRNGEKVDTIDGPSATKNQIIRLMIDKNQEQEYVEKSTEIGDIYLEAKNMSDGKVVKDCSFHVHKGEVIGFFGTVGSGRTELLEMIFGARERVNGEIFINNKEVDIDKVSNAIDNGMALIPEDKMNKALFLDENINFNLTLPFINKFANMSVIDNSREKDHSRKVVERLSIKAPGIETKVDTLSGGNKQKVSFGKWVESTGEEIDLYIFDEPTEGVDVGVRAEMHKIIVELAENGAACIVISSDIAEILGLSERIYVMHEGEIIEEFNNKRDIDLQEKVISASLGFKEEENNEEKGK